MQPRRLPPKINNDREYYFFALRIVGDFGASIAIPLVIFVLIGRYLDGRFGHGYWWTIAAFILAFAVSIRLIYVKTKRYGEEFQRLTLPKK